MLGEESARRLETSGLEVTGRVVGPLITCASLLAPLVSAGAPGSAQPPSEGEEEELPAIQLSGAGVELLRVAIPRAQGGGADTSRLAVDTMSKDMDITGFFQILDPGSFPAGLLAEGLNCSTALWTQVGAQVVIKVGVTGDVLEGRLYLIDRGDDAVFRKSYHVADMRDAVHTLANDVVHWFTGQDGIFGSRIAFALTGRSAREIGVVDADGERMVVVTHMGAVSLLPAYSPTGREIAFTSYLHNNPDLWLVPARGGPARCVSNEPGLNTGAAWSPDGRSIALTMSYQGNCEIYRIDSDNGRVEARLTKNPAIDSSATFSPDGSQIAFVSDRQGSPQIFVMPTSGDGGAKRVTFQGRYNQTPRWNPRSDKVQIAFAGRDEHGVFDIYVLDPRTSKVDRVTEGKGSNLDPTWSPDGRLLAYVSSRGGIYVNNPATHHEVQVWRGSAASPSWGPMMPQK